MKTLEQKEAEKLAKAEAKAKVKAEKEAVKLAGTPEAKKIPKFEDIDSSSMVNGVKALRAYKAVFGGAKAQSAEITLASKLRGEGLKGEELILEVYKGLGGLVDKARAKINRKNEEKARIEKASR